MNPSVTIHVDQVCHNMAVIQAMAGAHDIKVSVVTKSLIGHRGLVQALAEAGAQSLCEANIRNLETWADLGVERWLIRPPMLSQIDQVVRHADISLNSEMVTIRALGAAASSLGRTHKVVVMVDLGDTREGVMPDEVVGLCRQVTAVEGVELYGIGTEFGCISGVIPTMAAMTRLAILVHEVEDAVGFALPVVSGGSSNALIMLQHGLIPLEVNHLRLGESILLGRVADYHDVIPGCHVDPFTFAAEIIEIQRKPSQPVGDRPPGVTPIADDPDFPDQGVRLRALVAAGKQDVDAAHLTPHDPDIKLGHGSSDVFVADITDCRTPYRVGDVLTFSMDYYAILHTMVSPLVEKVLVP